MTSRDFGFIVLGAAVGLLGFAFLNTSFYDEPARIPRVGGQEVPQKKFPLDFSRSYHLVTRESGRERVYQNVKILGYTGSTVKDTAGEPSGGYNYFDRWLAIELPDKRRAYLPANSIASIEEIEAR